MIVNRLIDERNNTWTHEWALLGLRRRGPSRGWNMSATKRMMGKRSVGQRYVVVHLIKW